MASGVPFRMLNEEERRDRALSHDYTGVWWHERGYEVTLRTAREAGRVLAGLLDDHDVVLYEYFLTDLAGHRGTWAQKLEQAGRAEDLIDAVLDSTDLGRHRVVVISDHGNLEEGTHKHHTLNAVPLLAWGRDAGPLIDRVRGLDELTPALLD
jgi:2,3-bisphosphoglycerate-independent phosphoglycerate mutase